MEHKDVKLRIKSIEPDGSFEGYAAVFGNVDRDGEIIAPTAFDRTVKGRNGEPVPVLWQHSEPAGNGELSLTRSGLYIKGRLLLSTRTGSESYEFIKAGIVKGMSIGYRVVKDAWNGSVRTLQEIELFEVSLVTIPANPEASIVSVKACDDCPNHPSTPGLSPDDEERQQDDLQALPSAPASKASDPPEWHSLAVALDALNASAIAIKEMRRHG